MTTLGAYLQRERLLVVARWFALVLETYPPELAQAIAEDPDEFRNPMGHAFRTSLNGLVTEFLGEFDQKRVEGLLEPMIRIRAVQCFSPLEAVGFVFGLKRVVRELSSIVRETPTFAEELRTLDDRVDRAALVACNLFSRCRGRISAIRAREHWRRVKAAGVEPTSRRPTDHAAVRKFPVPTGEAK